MAKHPYIPTKGPKTRRLAEARVKQLMFHHVNRDRDDLLKLAREQVPEAWHTLEMDIETFEPKQKVSLYLDKSVVKMFRAMGGGYQARINRILATWLQMKMADLIGLEMSMIEALVKADEDSDREETPPEEMIGRHTLHQHWAYNEGRMAEAAWRDRLAEMEAEEKAKGD